MNSITLSFILLMSWSSSSCVKALTWWANDGDSVEFRCKPDMTKDFSFCTWTRPKETMPMLHLDIEDGEFSRYSAGTGSGDDCNIKINAVETDDQGLWKCHLHYNSEVEEETSDLRVRFLQDHELYPHNGDGKMEVLPVETQVHCRVLVSRPAVHYTWTLDGQDITIHATTKHEQLNRYPIVEDTFTSESILTYNFATVAEGSQLSCHISHMAKNIVETVNITSAKSTNPTTILNGGGHQLLLKNYYFDTSVTCFSSEPVFKWTVLGDDVTSFSTTKNFSEVSTIYYYSVLLYKFDNIQEHGSEIKCINDAKEDKLNITVKPPGPPWMSYDTSKIHFVSPSGHVTFICSLPFAPMNYSLNWIIDGIPLFKNVEGALLPNSDTRIKTEYSETKISTSPADTYHAILYYNFGTLSSSVHDVTCQASNEDIPWYSSSTVSVKTAEPSQIKIMTMYPSYEIVHPGWPSTIQCQYQGFFLPYIRWGVEQKHISAPFTARFDAQKGNFLVSSNLTFTYQDISVVTCDAQQYEVQATTLTATTYVIPMSQKPMIHSNSGDSHKVEVKEPTKVDCSVESHVANVTIHWWYNDINITSEAAITTQAYKQFPDVLLTSTSELEYIFPLMGKNLLCIAYDSVDDRQIYMQSVLIKDINCGHALQMSSILPLATTLLFAYLYSFSE